MDLLVLQRLARELDGALRGSRIEQVYALPKNDVVLVVGRRKDPRLWFSAEPDHPHLYLRPGRHPTPKRPPGFAMAARNALCGRRIASVECMYGDRVVEIRCSGDDGVRAVFELIPRRATALIVDGDDIVVAAWQPRRGRPGLSEPYAPPQPDRRATVETVENTVWDLLRDVDDDELVRGLLRSIAGMSPLVAREIVSRYRAGTPLREAARAEVERGAEAADAPRIYAPRPLDSIKATPKPRAFFIAPYEMAHAEEAVSAGDLYIEPFATMSDAAATYFPLRASLNALETARSATISALDIGLARTARTLDAVADDADAAGDAAQHRQWADLLLAYPRAHREGSMATVPDPWATPPDAAAMLEVPIDPSRSLVDNAQTYYGRARRAERSAKRTAARRHTLGSRIIALRKLAAEAAEANELRDCLRIARSALPHGVKVQTDRWTVPESSEHGDPPAAADERQPAEPATATANRRQNAGTRTATANGRQQADPPATAREGRGAKASDAVEQARAAKLGPGIDRYESSDGFEILVGRNARANERVTHRIAAPHDFWLHAEGPGSHVIIRNPGRAEEPSETSLRQAASLAAYFSSARGATKVNVRWTQAKQVKKTRGGPVGQVVLRRSRTYLAEPLEPTELLGK